MISSHSTLENSLLCIQALRKSSKWKSMESRKNFLNEVAFKLSIKHPSDWGKITYQRFCDLGGRTLLNNYYNGSLFNCLQDVYKGMIT